MQSSVTGVFGRFVLMSSKSSLMLFAAGWMLLALATLPAQAESNPGPVFSFFRYNKPRRLLHPALDSSSDLYNKTGDIS